jgi:hypothetical protein
VGSQQCEVLLAAFASSLVPACNDEETAFTPIDVAKQPEMLFSIVHHPIHLKQQATQSNTGTNKHSALDTGTNKHSALDMCMQTRLNNATEQ